MEGAQAYFEAVNKRGGVFDAADLALSSAAAQAASVTLRALRLESTKETVKRQELRWARKDGVRVLGYSTLLIQDPRGQVVGAGITFQDITQFQK